MYSSYSLKKFTILSANLSNIEVGSVPGVKMNTKGDTQFESANDAAKSNGGGSMNLLPKKDSSVSENKTRLYILSIYFDCIILDK